MEKAVEGGNREASTIFRELTGVRRATSRETAPFRGPISILHLSDRISKLAKI